MYILHGICISQISWPLRFKANFSETRIYLESKEPMILNIKKAIFNTITKVFKMVRKGVKSIVSFVYTKFGAFSRF